MLPLLRSSGAGCITAATNLVAADMRTIYDHFTDDAAVAAAQARVTAWRAVTTAYVQIPTVKAMIGLKTGEPGWTRVRPPLLPLDDVQLADVAARFAALA